MAALTAKRMTRFDTLKTVSLPLATQAVFQGGIACYDTAALGSVKKGVAGTATLVKIGEFAESADNSGGNSPRVLVKLDREIFAEWYDNSTGANAATLAANLFGLVYIADDHTVTTASSGNSVAGRVWDVDSLKGVLVEKATPSSSAA